MKSLFFKTTCVVALLSFGFIPTAHATGPGGGGGEGCPGGPPACGPTDVENKSAEISNGKVTCTLDAPCKCCSNNGDGQAP